MSSDCYFIATSWIDSPISLHFRRLAQELAGRGHSVVLLVDGQRTDVEDHAANPAVFSWPSKRPTHLRDARFLRDLIRRHRPGCLISNFGATNVCMLVGWLMRVPHRVCWYHTMDEAIARDSSTPPWKRRLLRRRKQLVYRAATHVVANSEA